MVVVAAAAGGRSWGSFQNWKREVLLTNTQPITGSEPIAINIAHPSAFFDMREFKDIDRRSTVAPSLPLLKGTQHNSG